MKRLIILLTGLVVGLTSNAQQKTSSLYADGWLDSMVPALSVVVGATAPTLSSFNSGPSVYFFDNNQDDHVYFTLQLNHNIKTNSTSIKPHIHVAQTAADTGKNMVWQLTYQIAGINGTFAASQTLLSTNAISGTQWKHQIVSFDDIAFGSANYGISAIMIGEIKRLANSATADDATQGIAFLGFDLHYEVDTPQGSSQAVSK